MKPLNLTHTSLSGSLTGWYSHIEESNGKVWISNERCDREDSGPQHLLYYQWEGAEGIPAQETGNALMSPELLMFGHYFRASFVHIVFRRSDRSVYFGPRSNLTLAHSPILPKCIYLIDRNLIGKLLLKVCHLHIIINWVAFHILTGERQNKVFLDPIMSFGFSDEIQRSFFFID